MQRIHYTDGYGGKFNYKTYCGNNIDDSRKSKDEATIHPEKVTCKECKKSNEFKQDLSDLSLTKKGIKRRIYLESDILHASELRSAQSEVACLCEEKGEKFVRRVFSEVLDRAWHDLENTWRAVKAADEIYSDSSLMPLIGNSYMGAPVIFNGMCERAIKEKVTGKSVYILRSLKDIYWDMIEVKLLDKAFKKNYLYMYNEKREIEQVDIDKLLKDLKKK